MPFVAVPNAAEFIIRGSVEGQEVVNTFYGVHTTTFDIAELDVAAGILSSVWSGDILPFLSSSYSFAGVHARGLRTPVDIETDDVSDAGVGGVATGALPNNVAFCVKRLSGLAGRSARGRVFIGGIPFAERSSTNVFDVSWAADIVAGLNGLRTAWVAADWLEVIVSRRTAGVANIPPISRLVNAYVASDLNADSQRRRLPGRGV